jgi:hypothetical protein
MLALRSVNEFLRSNYTVEQLLEWDPVMFAVVEALREGIVVASELGKSASGANITAALQARRMLRAR